MIENYRLLFRTLCSQTTELREYVQYNKTNIKKYTYIYIYIYNVLWLITKLSLNLLVLHTGAVKVRPDLKLYICRERVVILSSNHFYRTRWNAILCCILQIIGKSSSNEYQPRIQVGLTDSKYFCI